MDCISHISSAEKEFVFVYVSNYFGVNGIWVIASEHLRCTLHF